MKDHDHDEDSRIKLINPNAPSKWRIFCEINIKNIILDRAMYIFPTLPTALVENNFLKVVHHVVQLRANFTF